MIIGDSTDPRGQRRFARQVEGAVTVEAVDLRDLTDSAPLNLARPEALSVVADFAENLMSRFSADDLVRSVAAVNAGKFGRALSDIERAAATFEASRTLAEVADLLTAINRAGGVQCYRPAVLSATQQALQVAASAGGPSFRDATITIREQSRFIGRPLASRSVGSTLLLKVSKPTSRLSLMPAAQRAQSLCCDDTRLTPGARLHSDTDPECPGDATSVRSRILGLWSCKRQRPVAHS